MLRLICIRVCFFFSIIFFFFLLSCRSRKNVALSSSDKLIIEKYSQLLSVNSTQIESNLSLFRFVNEWIGVPYLFGGKDKKGIDCSAFVARFLKDNFNLSAMGSANDMFEKSRKIQNDKVQLGNLVFFKIESKKISHVGVFLMNNKFIHASSSKGVVISNLDENYYKKYFVGFGAL